MIKTILPILAILLHSASSSKNTPIHHGCKTNETHVYEYSTTSSLSLADAPSSVDHSWSAKVYVTCISPYKKGKAGSRNKKPQAAVFDMTVTDVKRQGGAKPRSWLPRKSSKDSKEFSRAFQFSGMSVEYEEDESSVVTNAKKAIVESFLLPRHVSFGTDRHGSMNSIGHRDIIVEARRDELDGDLIDIVENATTDSFNGKLSSAATFHASDDIDIKTSRSVKFNAKSKMILNATDVTTLFFTKNTKGDGKIMSTTKSSLIYIESISVIDMGVDSGKMIKDTILADQTVKTIQRSGQDLSRRPPSKAFLRRKPDTNEREEPEISEEGDVWVRTGEVYDLIEPLAERISDVETYSNHTSYLYGKELGVDSVNLKTYAGLFVGDASDSRVKTFARVISKAKVFNINKTLVDVTVSAVNSDKFDASVTVKFLESEVYHTVLTENCTAGSRSHPIGKRTLILGRSTYSLPIKGFTVALDLAAFATIDLHLDYDICAGDESYADVDLLGKTRLSVDGKAKILVEFGGDTIEGGLVLKGGINSYLGPTASVGKNAKSGGGFKDSCIALKSGNDADGVAFSVYYLEENGDKEWTRDLKVVSVEASSHETECLRDSEVSINGLDPWTPW